jgi:hypothetical protein
MAEDNQSIEAQARSSRFMRQSTGYRAFIPAPSDGPYDSF